MYEDLGRIVAMVHEGLVRKHYLRLRWQMHCDGCRVRSRDLKLQFNLVEVQVSGDAVKVLISHALTDNGFQEHLIRDPQSAIGSQHGLRIVPADLSGVEIATIRQLNKADFDAMKAVKDKLNPLAHEITGGVIL